MSYTAVTLVRIRREGLNEDVWTDSFCVPANLGPADAALLDYLRDVIRSYLDTPNGRDAAERSCYDFNWGDVVQEIPDEFWNQYDIHPLRAGSAPFLCSNATALLVNQDEVLCDEEPAGGDNAADSGNGLCDTCENRITERDGAPTLDCRQCFSGVEDIKDDGQIVTACDDYKPRYQS